jgi:hypothetical protein
VYQNFLSWIGGYKSNSGWVWVSGEPWSYTNWYPGEPNNGYGDESKLHLVSDDYANIPATWNDAGNPNPAYLSDTMDGYVVEYEGGKPMPEFPSAFLPVTMIIGFLGVVLLIQRTRKH